jgi:hypothetical protein
MDEQISINNNINSILIRIPNTCIYIHIKYRAVHHVLTLSIEIKLPKKKKATIIPLYIVQYTYFTFINFECQTLCR